MSFNTPLFVSILYQDKDIIVIHKPAGLLVHRSPIDKRETEFAVEMTQQLIGQKVYTVHRLDRPTSGVLIFALSSKNAHHLAKQFEEHTIVKTYIAICRGWTANMPGHPDISINRPLKYHADKIAESHKKENTLQEAQTDYRILAHTTLNKPLNKHVTQRYSLIELTPSTGRKHQLRRHMNHINHPIIGDIKHGDRHHNHLFTAWRAYSRLYLAATNIAFIHPVTNEKMQINAPLEPSFLDTLHKLNLTEPSHKSKQ